MEQKFQQYYPTYNYKNRDIVLLEFEEAQRISNSQSKLYGQLANLLLAFVTVGVTALVKSSDNSNVEVVTVVRENVFVLNFFLSLIGFIVLRYFIELQKTIVINSRKAITLRGMLGLDYGHLQLTIPRWRVEGATNPFVIKHFPGWFSFGSSPFWVIVFSLNILWYLTYKYVEWELMREFWFFVNVFITLLFVYVYRMQLREYHETFGLLFIKIVSKILRIKLIKNFEYVLYRAKLSTHEKNRLQYDTLIVEQTLIEIEDVRFFKHKGVDIKALGRSVLSMFKSYRSKKRLLKSGGSTITMQLCRTLFIRPNKKVIQRKIIEILLSLWFERLFSKLEIINFYLTSVRFERKINGIISATNYFFPNKKDKKYSYEEAFFLVERLSNISSSYRLERIESLLSRINSAKQINKSKLIGLYQEIENKGLICRDV
ncbi:biosynthetic peptidoglycan transglycosylase [Porphyromonas loveana]|uniref:Penicillin-binding protein 1A n=1 Tax=Porphyromonas loveana TaxID=1884669 RepID=A0A2U1EX35_9PORP|nr:biosynthetic peptidoglycan transglycosylase [Porphyromonas loveana]PVZ04300.1 penicillin-binding protein 1A [Porphyromonas loveana]